MLSNAISVINQLVQSNQSKLQAFEVKILSMSKEDRGYLCDKTKHMLLEKVFAGMSRFNALHFTFRASFEKRTEKNVPLIRGQEKQTRKTKKKSRSHQNAVISKTPQVFRAKFNDEYEFYEPTLSYFFRLLYHPTAYFREVSMFAPMTDRFCAEVSKSFIRCEQFTLYELGSSPEHSLKWLKENVRAQQIILSLNYYINCTRPDILFSEFLLQNSCVCAQDRLELVMVPEPEELVNALIKKYETLEVRKAIPTIALKFNLNWNKILLKYFEFNFDAQYDTPLYDERCDGCNIETYERPHKLGGSRKVIVQVRRCLFRCDSMAYMKFE
ncbi:hypothetical protein DdX_17007 [Ditylenchus destructor]|uniref:Uncharacterized protein n=1 Tax=Ditylenchus destructor TaxID=166010 RepID=A0AAD4MN01_9BILA|nr:hypothetical protein DdX_17007 [Ditylenchus destructor]